MTELAGQAHAGLKPLLGRLARSSPLWGWADQLVVSGAGFATLVLIARATDASELGAYAIGGSIIALLIAAQDSLITRPYAIHLYKPLGTEAQHAFSVMALSILAGILALLALSLAGIFAQRLGYAGEVTDLALALALAAPFLLLREFVRRYGFTHLQTFKVFLLDAGIAVLTLAALLWLSLIGRLTIATAFLAIALSSLTGSLAWLMANRHRFAPSLAGFSATLQQSWALGKWLLSGQIAIQAQGYMTHWLSLLIAGVATTGVYAACMSIIAFSNPLLYGFFNILTPKYVRCLREKGADALVRHASRDALFLSGVMGGFCIIIALAGEALMRLLFPSPEFSGHGLTLVILSLSVLASAAGAPASIALAAMERGRSVAVVMTATAALNILLLWWLLSLYGLIGAASGALIAEIMGSTGRWTAFLNAALKQDRSHACDHP